MNNDWYQLDISIVVREKKQHIDILKKRINMLFTNPASWDEVMVFSPKKEGVRFSPIWIISPKTVVLLPKETLILSGAEKCPKPSIDEVSVTIGEEQNIHYHLPNNES